MVQDMVSSRQASATPFAGRETSSSPPRRSDSRSLPRAVSIPAAQEGKRPRRQRLRGIGYRMIESFTATNFRCFESLKLRDLRRVNVITGSNGSGKSALIEAIYLASNATGIAVQNIANARSLGLQFLGGAGSLGPVPVQIPNMSTYFDHLFREYKVTKPENKKNGSNNQTDVSTEIAKKIDLSFLDSDGTKYDLIINYQGAGPADQQVLVIVGRGPQSSPPIIFDRRKTLKGGNPHQSQRTPLSITMNQFGQLQHAVAAPFGPTALIFGADLSYAENDNVMWFSQLKTQNKAQEVIGFIRKEFPFVADIEVLAPTGTNGLYATLTDGSHRRVTVVSAGIYKIISILLAAANTHDGVIFVDEIENGIFYEKYPAIWRVLYDFVLETKNQLFISSHSAECLQALPDIIGDNEDDFCLLRTERQNGICTVDHISGDSMKAALKGKNEVRGATIGSWRDKP
jgi:hypothetical protein